MVLQVYENVHCLDFSALYPNIIRQCNLSPEFNYSKKFTDGDDNLVINKSEFSNTKIGILPQLATKLIIMRKDYRSKGMEAEQLACKIAVNSMYGVLSQKTAKYILGGTNIASTVTWVGRNILHGLVERLPSYDIKVIYGKTDSIFVISETIKDKDEILSIGQSVASELVKELTGFDNEYIVFDYEEFIEKMVLVNKNNYVKSYGDNRKLKGATFFNSKTSDYENDVMNFLLDKIIFENIITKEDLSKFAMDFLRSKINSKPLDYFAINHKPRLELINKFDQVNFMLDNDINIEYGFNHRAVICDYDGNSDGVLVYPIDYDLSDYEFRVDRKWLESINKKIINKLDLKSKQKQFTLDSWN